MTAAIGSIQYRTFTVGADVCFAFMRRKQRGIIITVWQCQFGTTITQATVRRLADAVRMKGEEVSGEAEAYSDEQFATIAPQEPPPSFDGDWIVEIIEPNYMPDGIRVRTKIIDNKFSLEYAAAGGWRGTLSGEISSRGRLAGSGSARMGNLHTDFMRIAGQYTGGSFRVMVHTEINNPWGGGGQSTVFEITLTRDPTGTAAAQD